MTPGQAITAVEAYQGSTAREYEVKATADPGVIRVRARYLGGWLEFDVIQTYEGKGRHRKPVIPTADHVEEV